jgi:hypothetical protein
MRSCRTNKFAGSSFRAYSPPPPPPDPPLSELRKLLLADDPFDFPPLPERAEPDERFERNAEAR